MEEGSDVSGTPTVAPDISGTVAQQKGPDVSGTAQGDTGHFGNSPWRANADISGTPERDAADGDGCRKADASGAVAVPCPASPPVEGSP